MKRLILSICAFALLTHCPGQVRGRIGTGATEMLSRESACICIGHSFAPRWSAESEVTFGLPRSERPGDNEWTEHNNEFADEDTKENGQVPGRFTVSLRHWHGGAYDGGCVLVGITQYNEKRPVIHTGAAYYMKIWRHLGIDLSFRIDLNGWDPYKAAAGSRMTLTIDYLF